MDGNLFVQRVTFARVSGEHVLMKKNLQTGPVRSRSSSPGMIESDRVPVQDVYPSLLSRGKGSLEPFPSFMMSLTTSSPTDDAVKGPMEDAPREKVTVQLNAWLNGADPDARDVMGLIYDELCLIARSQLKKERAHHSFKTQGLVHEAYLRLCDQKGLTLQNRSHFFGVAARTMRQILIDHAREGLAAKRGRRYDRVYVESIESVSRDEPIDILRLDQALEDLNKKDEAKALMVELRYFGGLTIEETAEALSMSPAKLKREWKFAKAWLLRHMKT